MMKSVLFICISFSLFVGTQNVVAQQRESAQTIEQLRQLREEQFQKQIDEGLDAFYDGNRDYSRFSGRVSDRDNSGTILKIASENKNIRFFRAGDLLKFHLESTPRRGAVACEGSVRAVEQGHFVIFVKDLTPCFGNENYFRRGSVLIIDSQSLANRVEEASKYRVVLLKRRRDFFEQLNKINQFVWSYDQQRVLVAAEYDREILALQKAKEDALTMLVSKKQNQVRLQGELSQRLDELDRDLDFYRIRKDEMLVDRWHKDHDLGLPVGRRPQDLIAPERPRDADELSSKVIRAQ
jgi:hypothetical protein